MSSETKPMNVELWRCEVCGKVGVRAVETNTQLGNTDEWIVNPRFGLHWCSDTCRSMYSAMQAMAQAIREARE